MFLVDVVYLSTRDTTTTRMQYAYQDVLTNANLVLHIGENRFEHAFFSETLKPVLTIAWNRGQTQRIFLDGDALPFPAGHFAPLTVNQTFRFERPDEVIIWQFDKPFYCIEDNDREVSCIGFLFWGHQHFLTIRPDDAQTQAIDRLLALFVSEFQTADTIQSEMLRALLKRLIITLNGMAKAQNVQVGFKDTDLDLVRQFNVLVEKNFRRLHQVQDYARLLHKSPKTLTNLFAIYNNKSPLEVIHDRLLLEAKRLLLYTDQPVKEVAYTLGFEDVSHFSRFFRKGLGVAPGEFRLAPEQVTPGRVVAASVG